MTKFLALAMLLPLLSSRSLGEPMKEKDKLSRSRDMIAAIQAAGGVPKYTELKGVGHNAWSATWASDELWDWLLAQARKEKEGS